MYDVEKVIHNLIGLVSDKEVYKQRYLAKFPNPTKLAIYDETIPNNATNVVQAKAEAIHTEKLRINSSLLPPNAKPATLFLQ